MKTKLIRLGDDTLVEVEVADRESVPIAGEASEKLGATMDAIQPVLLKACKPVISVWSALKEEITIEKTEIEFGLSFEGEGNIFISKAKAGANLTVRFTLKPQY
jgi:hypothetical protein